MTTVGHILFRGPVVLAKVWYAFHMTNPFSISIFLQFLNKTRACLDFAPLVPDYKSHLEQSLSSIENVFFFLLLASCFLFLPLLLLLLLSQILIFLVSLAS